MVISLPSSIVVKLIIPAAFTDCALISKSIVEHLHLYVHIMRTAEALPSVQFPDEWLPQLLFSSWLSNVDDGVKDLWCSSYL